MIAALLSNPTIIALFTAIVAGLGWGLHQRIAGAKAERNANAKKELDAYEQSLKDLAAANRAGAAVRPDDGGVQRDPNNRDGKSFRVSGLG